jgi:acyl transferase domain-containing protein
VGLLAADYTLLHARTQGAAGIGPYYATGKEPSFAAGRISYAFDLHGPAMGITTACSSSLLAVHLACRSLLGGECDAAVAAGVNLMLGPDLSVFMSRVGALSPSGSCRPFAADADGVVRGEGCGAVVLKRLADAERDGDHVWALVRGSAVNHDGHSAGLTAPNARAQVRLVRAALADAALDPEDVDVVEAHATGTSLGDPIELSALAEVYGAARSADRPLVVGSHKAHLGHLDAAAGVIGLLKAVVVLRDGVVPAQPFARPLTAAVDWERSGLHVPARAVRLERDGPLRAGVSAFGLSGTNVHVLLEAPPPVELQRDDRLDVAVLPVSARTPAGLMRRAASIRELLAGSSEAGRHAVLASSALRRDHERHRRALVAGSPAALLDDLDAVAAGATGAAAPAEQRPATAFVFSGQGAQWAGMGADLMEADADYRAAIEECDALMHRHVSWSLVDELRASPGRLDRTEVAQPAVFAVQVGLTRCWRRLGIAPDAVIGHSVGEVAAAHVAGALTLEDAVRLIVLRGQLLEETRGLGAMAAVERDAEHVRATLDALGTAVVVAAVNGPTSCVLSGPAADLAVANRALERDGATCVPVPGGYPFHGPLVAPCADALRQALRGLAPREPVLRLVSTVEPHHRPPCDVDYWARNVSEPVRLWPAVDLLLGEGEHALVEVGVHPVLRRPLAAAAAARGRRAPVVASLQRGRAGARVLREGVARLYDGGVDPDWTAIAPAVRRHVPLPRPDWRDERHWLAGVGLADRAAAPARTVADRAEVILRDEAGGVLQRLVLESGERASPPAVRPPPRDESQAAPAAAPSAPADHAERVVRVVRELLDLGPDRRLPRDVGLFELGVDSLTAVQIAERLGGELGLQLGRTLVFEHPTVAAIAEYLEGLQATAPPPPPPAPPAPPADAPPAAPVADSDEAPRAAGAGQVAIIGMGCRLPSADGPEAYWSLLRDRGVAVGELPPERRARDGWDDVADDVPRRGCFLDDIEGFDAAFFRIAPREARSIDPQQRLLLEVAWEALEDAGIPAQAVRGRSVGVFAGLNTADYGQALARDADSIDLYFGTGTSFAAAAGRISYVLGARGPSMSVDTACSSSLTAVHLACRSMLAGECELAIVGGSNVIAGPNVSAAMSAGGALAPDGWCKAFSDDADGYGRGEGCGVIVLKALDRALADGDRVHAVVWGSAVNQDGASAGFTVPSAAAQQAVVAAALERAGCTGADIDVVEAHGTGTSLGDPIELEALAHALGPRADPKVAVGSAKATIGHLEAAAGIAGVIKVVLALRHGEVPPHPAPDPLSARVPWDRLCLRVPREVEPWQRNGRPRRAGISAFGFTGSNAHVIVGDAPAAPGDAPPRDEHVGPLVVPLSAATPAALQAVASRLATALAGDVSVQDAVYTLAHRRTHLRARAAVVGETRADLISALQGLAGGRPGPAVVTGSASADGDASVQLHCPDAPASAAFADWAAGTSVHRDAREHAERLAARILDGAPAAPGPRERVGRLIEQVAATAVWRAHGVEPATATGAGTGAATAAWVRGEIDLAAALRHAVAGTTPPDGRRRGAEDGIGAVLDVGLGGSAQPTEAETPAVEGAPTVISGIVAGVPACQQVAHAVARLHVDGRAHGWQGVAPASGRVVSLPGYPWEHRSHWALRTRRQDVPAPPPLDAAEAAGLGPPMAAADRPGTTYRSMTPAGPEPLDGSVLAAAASVAAAEDAGRGVELRGVVVRALAPGRGPGDVSRSSQVVVDLQAGRVAVHRAGCAEPLLHADIVVRAGPAGDAPALDVAASALAAMAPDGSSFGGASRLAWTDGDAGPTPLLEDARWVPADALLRSGAAAQRLGERLFQIGWMPVQRPSGGPAAIGPLVVVGRRAGGAGRLAAALEGLGDRAEAVAPPPPADSLGWRDLLEAATARHGRVGCVVLVAADVEPRAAAASSLIALGQALQASAVPVGSLALVTTGAVDPTATEGGDPEPAAAWEVGRVMAMELADRWAGMIDAAEGDEEHVARALTASGRSDQLAVRGGRWWSARLRRAPAIDRTVLQPALDPDRWYVLGDAAGPAARPVRAWLSARGAQRVLLVAGGGGGARSSGAPDEDTAGTWIAARDAPEHVRGLAESGALGGVIDCPTPPPSAALADVTIAAAAERAPTLLERLDEATRSHPPALFLSIVPGAPAWGAIGTAEAARGCGRASAIVRRRRAAGVPSQLLALLPREGTGEVAAEHETLMRDSGVLFLPDDAVIEILDHVVGTAAPEMHGALVDLDSHVALSQSLLRRAFLEELEDRDRDLAIPALRSALDALPAPARAGRLLEHVSLCAAEVLGLDGEVRERQGFFDLGMDSVMAVGLRTRLQRDLGVELASTVAFDHPTPAALAGHLACLLTPDDAEAHVEAEAEGSGLPALDAPGDTSDEALLDELQAAIDSATDLMGNERH